MPPATTQPLILRPYQEAARFAFWQAIRTRDDNPCLVLPTGSGKSPLMAAICRDAVENWNGRVLILAHVKELLEQTADKLDRFGLAKHTGIYSAGLNRRDTKTQILVAGIQSVYSKACDLGAFDIILIDECFPAGTMVDTPQGQVPIENVSVGDSVFCANGVGQVLATSCRQATSLVSMEFSDGTSLICTPNHRIFTERGWREARAMDIGSVTYSIEGVRSLWEDIYPMARPDETWIPDCSAGKRLEQAAMLLAILREEIQQPDEQVSYSPQGESSPQGNQAQADQAWRKRPVTTIATTSPVARFGRRVGGGIASGNEVSTGQPGSVSNVLQDRHWQQGENDCHRNRWPVARAVGSAGTGREKSRPSPIIRLVRVSRVQREGTIPVFNLHVSGHPSYFANGKLVHNCHLIPVEGEGRYRTFLADAKIINPLVRVGGFTATPYRLGDGMICGEENILNHIAYEVSVKELMKLGYLCQMRSKTSINSLDMSECKVKQGEFDAAAMEIMFSADEAMQPALNEIVERTTDRKSVLIFAAGVEHARKIQAELQWRNFECELIVGDTPSLERAETLDRFKAGQLKFLVNCNVLTTGFDATNIDCVVILRATLSPGLYYQICGRGFRIHPDKTDCLVLDFGTNIVRHGPVDCIKIREKGDGPAPTKTCPECDETVPLAATECPGCGYQFPEPDKKEKFHTPRASDKNVVSGEPEIETRDVMDFAYSAHRKKGAPDTHPRTLKVEYVTGLVSSVCEWVCVEHEGFARNKAYAWWVKRCGVPMPKCVDLACRIADMGGFAEPLEVTTELKPGERWPSVTHVRLGPIPDPQPIIDRLAELEREAKEAETDRGDSWEGPATDLPTLGFDNSDEEIPW